MTEHLITAHKGHDHVSSDDMRVIYSTFLGEGRHIIQGMELSIPNSTTLHISNGIALVDDSWYRISGAGENLPIANGTVGMNRRDAVFLVYTRTAEEDTIEDMHLEIVTGTPTTGSPALPVNQYPGSILAGDVQVWIPFAEIFISGLTVSRAVHSITRRTLTTPMDKCEQCDNILQDIRNAITDCYIATAQAQEIIRSVPDSLEQMRSEIEGMYEWLRTEQARNRADIEQLAAMLASNIANYVLIGEVLAAPDAWVKYKPEEESVQLEYSTYDPQKDQFILNANITVDNRIDEVHTLALDNEAAIVELRGTVDDYQESVSGQLQSIQAAASGSLKK